ncbi:MAG TPA: hypothetical protein DE060_09150 [Lentisphaeria bacterium]|nr:hypothetical protein [Lentisphaeria bacterium]HCG49352.1 hypothetical protein [Lentisphaeria bacterium]
MQNTDPAYEALKRWKETILPDGSSSRRASGETGFSAKKKRSPGRLRFHTLVIVRTKTYLS